MYLMASTAPAGKLAVLLPGLGAVATTFIAGVDAVRRGLSAPVGSVTQLGHVPVDPSTGLLAPFASAIPLARLDDLVFGGWDIYEGTAFDAAERADVLSYKDLERAREALTQIKPMRAVFDPNYIRNITGPNVKQGGSKWELAQALVDDIASFKKANGATRAVAVWCGSTERYQELGPVHQTIEAFERGLKESDPAISPSMMYAWAFIRSNVPYANGAPNMGSDIPALRQLAQDLGVPVAGKDFKTGQTLMKTILAPGFAARRIGVRGWYSTNILGNSDGAVLDDPGSFKSKEKTKLSVLESILDAEQAPELYGKLDHKVRIDYYPPRGDNKEGWDNIDIFGWMGYPMQIKINFLCRDSILAAPLVLDLALLLDAAGRGGNRGVQEWMSFFFKAPQTTQDEDTPVHDLFLQLEMLHEEVRRLGRAAGAPVWSRPAAE
jgi:myo-inositol-1-phosphate synthase